MRYVLRTVIGLGLMVASITLISYAVFQLLQIGTCASGGPYVSARECPPGTERIMLAIFPAVLVMLGAAALYASRGKAPGSDRDGPGGVSALLIIWSGLFLGIAFACFWGVWGPDANPGPGGDLGGLIVGFLFVPMGLAPLIIALLGMRGGRDKPKPIPGLAPAQNAMRSMGATVVRSPPKPVGFGTPAPTPGGPGGGDKVARLERLEQLRRDGVVTDAEFERLKAEILGG